MHNIIERRIRVHLWGELAVWDADGAPVPLPGRRARALVAVAAMAGGEPVGRERLAGLLWDAPEALARASLRQLLYELKALRRSDVALLGTDSGCVWLNAGTAVDVAACDTLDARALARTLPLRDMLLCADMDGLTEAFDEWLDTQRAVADAMLARAIARAGDAAIAVDDFAAARALADAATARDPLDEASAQLGLRADIALGNHAGAVRRLRRLEEVLSKELGVTPSPLTRMLAETPRVTPTEGVAAPDRHSASPPSIVVGAEPRSVKATARAPSKRTAALIGIGAIAAGIALVLALLRGGVPAFDPKLNVANCAECVRLTREARALDRLRTRGGYARAEALLRRAIALDPSYPGAWAELGLATRFPAVSEEQRHPSALAEAKAEALRYEDEALRLDPGNARALAIKAVILGEETGTRLLAAALRADPNDPEIWHWAGNDRWSFARWQPALDAYEHAAALDPAWLPPADALIVHAEELGDHALADSALSRFAAASRDHFKVERLTAELAMSRGQLGLAAQHFARALGYSGEGWKIAGPLAHLARAVGDRAAIRRLVAGDPDLTRMYAPLYAPEGAVTRAQADPDGWWRGVFLPEEERGLLRAGRGDLLVGLLKHQHRPLLLVYRNSEPYPSGIGAPLVVALRRASRMREADWLLDSLVADDRETGATGYDAPDLLNGSAMIAALQGRDADVARFVDRAFAKGWRAQTVQIAVDPGTDPLFARVRGRPDFEAARARLLASIAHERPAVEAAIAVAERLLNAPAGVSTGTASADRAD